MSLSNLLEELRNTTKPSEKQNILLKYDSKDLRFFIKKAYDPFELFHVKLKASDIPVPGQNTVEEVMSKIHDLFQFCLYSSSSVQNREKVTETLSLLDTGSQELLIGTLNKNWKVGVSSKTILKVFPEIVPVFEVQLSNKWKDYVLKKKRPENKKWWRSPKLDGVRCVAIRENEIEDKPWTFTSRQGHPFLTVDHLQEYLEKVYQKTGLTCFDGELYKHGLTFEEIQGSVMAYTQGTATDIEYHIFIAGNGPNFFKQDSKGMLIPSSEAFNNMDKIVLVDTKLISEEEIEYELDLMFEAGYEGMMLRDPDKLYEFKRSDALLKIKESLHEQSQEEISDCFVMDIEYRDDFPVIENGAIHYKRFLNKIWVLQMNGVMTKVGSGYDLKFREHYTLHPEELIGCVVEIKHQGYGNKGSMRFPRLHRVRYDIEWSGPEPYEEI